MESNSDSRFDPNFATHLLLDVAHEQSVEHLLQKLILRAMERPNSDVACLQIWLVDKGDLCSGCPQRPKCPDQTRCLHLVAGGGNSISESGAGASRFDDPNARMPLGLGLVGKVAATGQQLVLNGRNEKTGDAGELDCVAREQIRAFTGSPITFKGEVLDKSNRSWWTKGGLSDTFCWHGINR